MKRSYFTSLFCVLCLGGLAQCGQMAGKSKDVDFKLTPKNPIVINSDITLNEDSDDEIVVEGPWFLFSSSVHNGSDLTLILVNYSITISTMKSGVISKGSAALSINVACEASGGIDQSTGAEAIRNYMAIIPSKRTYTGLSDPCDESTIVSSFSEAWYIGSLQKSDTFSYTVNVDGEGWFQDSSGTPIERLFISSGLTTR